MHTCLLDKQYQLQKLAAAATDIYIYIPNIKYISKYLEVIFHLLIAKAK